MLQLARPGAAPKKPKRNSSSIRAALRKIAAAEFDLSIGLTPDVLAAVFGNKGAILTGAQLLAIRKISQAMKDGKLMDVLIDHIDGKQVQKTVEAKATLADIVAKSYDKDFLEGEDDGDDAATGRE